MRFIDLHIDGFGKFHDLALSFDEGMNILYGRNEAGKSTLHAFLQAMLYGLERRPGVGSAARLHKKYRPWDTPETFGGQLRLRHEGKIYRIVRDFSADDLSGEITSVGALSSREERTSLENTGIHNASAEETAMGACSAACAGTATNAASTVGSSNAAKPKGTPLEIWNESDGVRIENPKAFLMMLLGGISETAFENTVSIGQLRSATSRSMVRELKDYITNLSTTGDRSLDAAGALQLLKEQRSALEAKRVPEAAKSYVQLIGEIRNLEREISQPEYENQLRKYQELRSEVRTEQVDRQTRREELLQKTAAQEAVLSQAGFQTAEDIKETTAYADQLYQLCQIGAEPRQRMLRVSLPLLCGFLTLLFAVVGVLLLAMASPAFAARFCLVPEKLPGLAMLAAGLGLRTSVLAVGSLGLTLLCALLLGWRLYANGARTRFLRETTSELQLLLTKQIGSSEVTEAAMQSFHTHMEELARACAELEEHRTALQEVTAELQTLNNDERRYDVELQKQNEKQTELEGKLQHLSNVKNRAEMMKRTLDENDAITVEIDAINLAMETMNELQSSIQSSFGHYLNKEAGKLIAGITGGVYDSMWIDQNLDVFMNTPGKIVPIEDVSSGTMDQIYLALRLAAARLIQGGETGTTTGMAGEQAAARMDVGTTDAQIATRMGAGAEDGHTKHAVQHDEARLPLIFDDSFAMYDEDRLSAALQYIMEIHQGQILLFTCHTREQRILDQKKLKYQLIKM